MASALIGIPILCDLAKVSPAIFKFPRKPAKRKLSPLKSMDRKKEIGIPDRLLLKI